MMNSHGPTVVLVVEDEPMLRTLAVDIVELNGFTAIEASNADEAVAVLESRSDIDIVFTDVEMPGSMDGLGLAKAIRWRWPPIELIVTSGRNKSDASIPERGVFFQKPYRVGEIAKALQRMAA